MKITDSAEYKPTIGELDQSFRGHGVVYPNENLNENLMLYARGLWAESTSTSWMDLFVQMAGQKTWIKYTIVVEREPSFEIMPTSKAVEY